MTDEAKRIAYSLSEAQKRALVSCVKALSDAANNLGHAPSEEALYKLFIACGQDVWGTQFLTYEDWAESYLYPCKEES